MAKYREIKGVTVQTRDTDPTVNVGAWASVSALNTARDNGASLGTTDNAMAVGGHGVLR